MIVRDGAVRITRSGKFSDWNLTGYELIVDGPLKVEFSNTKLANPGGYRIASVGTGSPGATLTCSNCEFDEAGLKPLFEAGVMVAASSALSSKQSLWRGAPNDFGSIFGGFQSVEDLVQAPGVDGVSGAHLEAFHIYSGRSDFDRDVFDFTSHGHIPGAFTAFVFPEGRKDRPTVVIQSSTFKGTRSVKMNYAFQLSRATLKLAENRIERGTSGYVAPGVDASFTAANDRDADTGNGID